MTPDEQDKEDMGRLARGHEAALDSLMARHADKLFHFLIRLTGQETVAGDLAQDAFVRIFQNVSKFDPRQKFSTWLFAIAANLARDWHRWRTRHPAVSLDAESEATQGRLQDVLPDGRPTPEERLLATERGRLVKQAIMDLDEDLRTALVLAEYEEKSQAEIAAILGCMASYTVNDVLIKQILQTYPVGEVIFVRGVMCSLLIGAAAPISTLHITPRRKIVSPTG